MDVIRVFPDCCDAGRGSRLVLAGRVVEGSVCL